MVAAAAAADGSRLAPLCMRVTTITITITIIYGGTEFHQLRHCSHIATWERMRCPPKSFCPPQLLLLLLQCSWGTLLLLLPPTQHPPCIDLDALPPTWTKHLSYIYRKGLALVTFSLSLYYTRSYARFRVSIASTIVCTSACKINLLLYIYTRTHVYVLLPFPTADQLWDACMPTVFAYVRSMHAELLPCN